MEMKVRIRLQELSLSLKRTMVTLMEAYDQVKVSIVLQHNKKLQNR